METLNMENINALNILCQNVRKLVRENKLDECESIIAEAIGKFPHAAQPHNLFGVVFEKEGKHVEAMKHFRAAWALDPSYLPARCNMENYSSFFVKAKLYFDDTDCKKSEPVEFETHYDEFGIGRVTRRK